MSKIFRFSALMAAFLAAGSADAIGPQNSRAATATNVAPARATGRDVKRGAPESGAVRDTVVSRAATVRPNVSMARAGVTGRVATTRDQGDVARTATNSGGARSARSATTAPVRSAANVTRSGVSRAAMSRATAVFDDVSKIGGGYAQCREAYATCMDQFCAKANDTYRRCFCSDRFTSFRDTEDALDQAKVLLQQFEDNNLNAIDKTAAEVDAMYSATVGEAAIKNDTSGAAKLLAEIGDLISGKKKATSSSTSSTSLGVMSLDFSSDIGDIWGGSSAVSSVFGSDSGVNLSALEGEDLFNQVHKQCSEMISDSCQSSAVANMAKSAYGIMISQDCNAYEKSIDAKRQQVQNTVRQAEKILREARLEEYRAHNSQDVNECLDKVRTAMLKDTACGSNYQRCLDYTGAYINQSTGEPIYSARLFKLADLIVLNGASADVLAQNTAFDDFLDERRMFATTALDSCRDISSVVWTEFKRSALIEISQAQEEKLEEVRMSCVSTMKECYDTQSGALKDFDDTTAKAAGALSAYAAKAMCQDKVVACAALYGSSEENNKCTFDGSGRISNGQACGLTALLSFVNSVDNTRVAEGCETAVENYLTELCTPAAGDKGYPWGCRTKTLGNFSSVADKTLTATSSLADIISKYAYDNCKDPTTNEVLPTVTTKVAMMLDDVKEQLTEQLVDACDSLTGTWLYDASSEVANTQELPAFSTTVFAGKVNPNASTLGKCVESTVRVACLGFNSDSESPVATYNENTDTCTFTASWYENQCKLIGGQWLDEVCYF